MVHSHWTNPTHEILLSVGRGQYEHFYTVSYNPFTSWSRCRTQSRLKWTHRYYEISNGSRTHSFPSPVHWNALGQESESNSEASNVTKPSKLQVSQQILILPFSDDLLLSFFFSSDGELIFSDTSSLIPFAFLLMGLMEGALGRDGSVLFVCGGPGDWSPITCAHTFSILKYKQNVK